MVTGYGARSGKNGDKSETEGKGKKWVEKHCGGGNQNTQMALESAKKKIQLGYLGEQIMRKLQ